MTRNRSFDGAGHDVIATPSQELFRGSRHHRDRISLDQGAIGDRLCRPPQSMEIASRWDFIEEQAARQIHLVDISYADPLADLFDGSLVFFGIFAVMMLGVVYIIWSVKRDNRRRRLAEESSTQADS